MPILEILLAFGLGMFVWYAFEKWQFRRRVRLCSEWMLEESGTTLRGKSEATAPGIKKGAGRSRTSVSDQWPMQTPSGPEPLMQRAPGSQSSS